MSGKQAPPAPPPPPPPSPPPKVDPNAFADKQTKAVGVSASAAEREAAEETKSKGLGATGAAPQTRKRTGSVTKDPAAAVSNMNGALASPAVLTG